jgi:hypothetical protein
MSRRSETIRDRDEAKRFTIPFGTPAGNCRGCGDRIYWIRTENGASMPVNRDGTSHFSTCPDAESFRSGVAGEKSVTNAADGIPEEYLEELEERISILYYDGGLPMSMAEATAARQIRRKYGITSQGELF